MDGFAFDALTRSLIARGSRRRALTGLLLGSLGFLRTQAEETAAKNCKKIKNKAKRKKCLAKTKCVPNCAGKVCGDNSCGGLCGPCVRGTCQGGACVCPAGQDICDGVCMPACDPGGLHAPVSCRCCAGNGVSCDFDDDCCSGSCGGGAGCRGRNGLEGCTFGAQCRSGVCEAGTCTCDGEICNGVCQSRCVSPQFMRDPRDCGCCVNNGFDKLVPGNDCSLCCSEACNGDTCTGLPEDAPCMFNEQCLSRKCELNPCTTVICNATKYCQPA